MAIKFKPKQRVMGIMKFDFLPQKNLQVVINNDEDIVEITLDGIVTKRRIKNPDLESALKIRNTIEFNLDQIHTIKDLLSFTKRYLV